MSSTKFKAFLFDMDGTLVDSGLDFDLMRSECGFPEGVPLLEHIEEIKDEVDAKEVERFHEIIKRHEWEGALKSRLYSGVPEFINFLKANDIHTGVLTRNNKRVTDETFSRWDLPFEHVLTRECVTKPKPDPEGLFTLCKRLEVEPKESLYMGDFSFDLHAAHNAGMKAILYSPEKRPELEAQADYTVRCFHQLRENFYTDFLPRLGFA